VSEQYDKKAFFSQSINDNMHSLYSVALRLTRNSADAEDLVAEAASRAWSSLDSLEDRGRFRPWMFRILHNCYISDYRKKSVRPAETAYDELSTASDDSEIAALLIHQTDEFLNWWANPEREVFNKLLGNDLLAAIENLPESFRVVVVLINIEGLSYDDAAEVLDVSPGTIRSRMNRGRTLLQKSLWQHAQDAGLVPNCNQMESHS
jgi:RNA polymerase sigma-70 factor (ECF subfamily)